MNSQYDRVIAADDTTRAGLFTATAQRLGTTPANAEKDFWVCWTLDALFNGLPEGPRLLFKGGTSLSKCFGLIDRFSEDIDVTVFRDDLGIAASINDLREMSGKQRERTLKAIKSSCEAYINGSLLDALAAITVATSRRNHLTGGSLSIAVDPHDRQALILRYPSVTGEDAYVAKSVKIESGAKSALDPHSVRSTRPYVDADTPELNLEVGNITVVDAGRTLWDKIVILHGLRRWFDLKAQLRGDGQRVSRHYYDLHRLATSPLGQEALANRALGRDCVEHARMFFNRTEFDLVSAVPPTFALCPDGEMYDALRGDYRAMAGMIFGSPPTFETIVESVAIVEAALNTVETKPLDR